MLTSTKIKPRRCKHCRDRFLPERLGQIVHKECIEGYMAAEIEKRNRREQAKRRAAVRVEKAQDRKKRDEQKSHAEWHAYAQTAVNAFVRIRDVGLPCISCGTPWAPDFQAGHYRSRGAAKHLALDPRNIHGQCIQCNLHKHSNAVEYRIRLVERFGAAFVEAIECDQAPRHYSADDLKVIRADFMARAKQLKKEHS